MRESEVERYLRESVEAEGGLCIKFTSPSHRGVPDRIVIHPMIGTVFVELKAPGEKPRKQQVIRHKQIRDAGGRVHIIDSKSSVDTFILLLKWGWDY